MRYLQRYLSLLFALVMCVGIFSITAHAETLPNHTYSISSVSSIITGDRLETSVISYPENGEIERGTVNDWLDSQFNNTDLTDINLFSSFTVANDNGSSLFIGGRDTVVRFQNIYASFLFGSGSNQKYFYHNSQSIISICVYYVDSTLEFISSPSFISKGNGIYDITFSFTPSKDVKKIAFELSTWINPLDIKEYGIDMGTTLLTEVTINTGEYEDGNNYLAVEQVTEDTTLLRGILQKLTTGFESLISGIAELPSKIWEYIENGLKDLFVPSEEDMVAYKDLWDSLLSDRLGAVYQVVNILLESWDDVKTADQTNTIQFPQATLNFSGTEFTFGGYEVKVVPDGFEFLVTSVKLIVAIACTILFVNGLRKRYEEVMGVEK